MSCLQYDFMGYTIFIPDYSNTTCLCRLGAGESIDADDVRSLAYLGAAVAMIANGMGNFGTYVRIPFDLPDWVRFGIDRIVHEDDSWTFPNDAMIRVMNECSKTHAMRYAEDVSYCGLAKRGNETEMVAYDFCTSQRACKRCARAVRKFMGEKRP
jgi:hypothetical protein